MTARLFRVFGPDLRYRLALLHCWQCAPACFWLGGVM